MHAISRLFITLFVCKHKKIIIKLIQVYNSAQSGEETIINIVMQIKNEEQLH